MKTSRTTWFALTLLVGCAAWSGCNALTGAGDYRIDNDFEDDDDDGDDGASGSGDPSGPAGATSGGDPAGSGAASSGASTGEPPAGLGAVAGVWINEVSFYQGVKRVLMQGGQAVGSNVPVIAGRDAMVRLFTTVDGSYDGAPVTLRLYVGEGTAPFEVTQSVGASSESNIGSSVNFVVPGAMLTPGMGYRVEVGRAGAEGGPGTYPADGWASTEAQNVGPSLKIHLVPVSYGADGSNRLPDTTPAQLKRYEDRFYSMYPVPKIELTVNQAVGWDSAVQPNGSGWDSLLSALASMREQDNAGNDVYYYGIFAPANSMGSYCGFGCVSGLGMIGGPSDSYSRVAIGLGFTGEESADTAVHEIGHTHGRDHAPCQTSGDPAFPHPNGSIGVWGYDLVKQQLMGPNTSDLMGYCFPIWVSDYNYNALFNRIKFVNNAQITVPEEQMNLEYDRVSIGPDGEATWLSSIQLRRPPLGEATEVTLDTDAGSQTVAGAFFPYDHLDGGVLIVQKPTATLQGITAKLAGKAIQLAK